MRTRWPRISLRSIRATVMKTKESRKSAEFDNLTAN